jgi:predicted DNA-binding protein (MmcQ/YjbR family)
MNIEEIREECLKLPYVEEYMPFSDEVLCFKVGGIQDGKIFALLSLRNESTINLKNTPEKCIELRESHHQIVPGYHMNKKHWNTILYEEGLPSKLLREIIADSYQLVYHSLPKKLRLLLEER